MKKTLIGIGVAALVAVAIGGVAWAHNDNGPTIPLNLQGKSTLSVTPDTLEATVTLRSDETNGSDAVGHVSAMMQRVIDALNAAGVSKGDIKTGTISAGGPSCNGGANPQPDMMYCPSMEIGSSATITIRIHDMTKAGSILSSVIAIDSDANDKDSVQLTAGNFTVSNKEAVEQKAQALAVANARAQAKGIAKASGRHLGRLTDLEVVGAPYLTPTPIAEADRGAINSSAGKSATPTVLPVEAGDTDITATVNVTYQLN